MSPSLRFTLLMFAFSLLTPLAQSNSPSLPVPGQSPDAIKRAWGTPTQKSAQKQTETWRYATRENIPKDIQETLLDWQDGKLLRVTFHFSPPRTAEAEIPEHARLEPLEYSPSPDVRVISRVLGEPATGKIWELNEKLLVRSLTHGPSWKASKRTRSRTKTLEALKQPPSGGLPGSPR